MFKLTVGILAASLTTIAFLPQAIKTWKTKSTDDLSPLMFLLFCLGVVCWFTYGIILKDPAMIVGNIVTICLAGSIMYFIIKQKHMRRITHIALWVNNIELAKEFYCNYLNGKAGKKYANKKNDFCSYFISFTSGPRLELMSSLSGRMFEKSLDRPHFAISVGSKKKVKALTSDLRNQGVKIVSEPRRTGDGYFESVIADREGNLIEITI